VRPRGGKDRALVETKMAIKTVGSIKTVASKVKVATQKSVPPKEGETPEKDGPETPDAPLPLLDLSDAAVKKMIKQAKKRGFVTYEQLNSVMPSEEVTTDQIEDVLAMMSEMGINVVETEEADTDEEEAAREEPEEEEAEVGDLV
jgi:RNA polymerase primary sigma factor